MLLLVQREVRSIFCRCNLSITAVRSRRGFYKRNAPQSCRIFFANDADNQLGNLAGLGQKKAGSELFQSSLVPSHQSLCFNSGNIACNACDIDGRCGNTADHCSNRFGYMDNLRNSCNTRAGNTRTPGIHSSCIRMQGTRIQFLPAPLQPRLEHQLVSPEPEPVQLLLMATKEVFS